LAVDKRAVQLTMALSSFLTPFSGSSFNIALPSIAKEYGLSAIAMSWASLAYLLSSAMFLIPFGKVADMYGRKRVYLYGIGVFTLASGLLAVYPSSSTVVALRALQGLGSAMIFGTGVAILVSVHGPEERGAVLGVNAAMVYVGLSVGPSLGGLLTTNFGWRSIFLVNVGVGLLIIATTLLKVRAEWAEGTGRSFDIRGSAMYSLMLLVLMYGMSMLPKAGAYPYILGGLTLLCVFIYHETRAENPILDVNLFLSNRAFSFSNLAAFINFSATYAVTLLLSMYLQRGDPPPQHVPTVHQGVGRPTGRVLDDGVPHNPGHHLTVGGEAQRQGGPIQDSHSGDDGHDAVPAALHLPGGGNASRLRGGEPGPAGRRPGPLQLAQHQRHHGVGGPEVLRRGLLHGGHHEAYWSGRSSTRCCCPASIPRSPSSSRCASRA